MLRCAKINQATSAMLRTAVISLLAHEALMNLSCIESFPESLLGVGTEQNGVSSQHSSFCHTEHCCQV